MLSVVAAAHMKRIQEASQLYPNLTVLPQKNQLIGSMTVIRDLSTPIHLFVEKADRVISLLIEEALNLIPAKEKQVMTPLNVPYTGMSLDSGICGVSIVRAGESMEGVFRRLAP